MRPSTRAFACLAAACLWPAGAWAHGSIAGFGGFGSGFLHPLVNPALLLAIVVAALLIGQHGMEATQPAMAAAAAGLVLGLLATAFEQGMDTRMLLLAAAVATGVMVAIGRRWPRVAYGLLAALLGLGIGLGSEPDGLAGTARLSALAGTFVGGCIWIADGALIVQALKKPGGRVLVRVLAAAMAAGALLMLALLAAPPQTPPAASASAAPPGP